MTVFKAPRYYECAPAEWHAVTFVPSGCVISAHVKQCVAITRTFPLCGRRVSLSLFFLVLLEVRRPGLDKMRLLMDWSALTELQRVG